jgi:hypothetical protein
MSMKNVNFACPGEVQYFLMQSWENMFIKAQLHRAFSHKTCMNQCHGLMAMTKIMASEVAWSVAQLIIKSYRSGLTMPNAAN